MLKDEVRTESYRDAMLKNRHIFKDKIVLDIGCGSGILSMFAAQAGAKMVIGVEMSSIMDYTRKIVKANGFEDHIVLLHGKMEEVKLPVDKVDIIISEWMGYLLYESMLTLFCGLEISISKKTVSCFPIELWWKYAIEDGDYRKEKIDFWDNVYGFDMKCIKQTALLEPLVDTVENDAVITNQSELYNIDIRTVKVEQLAFKKDFKVVFNRDDTCHAIVVHFDTIFDHGLDTKIKFGTGPDDEYTHWKQTVFYLNDIMRVSCGDTLTGTISFANRKPRDLDIDTITSVRGERYSGSCYALSVENIREVKVSKNDPNL